LSFSLGSAWAEYKKTRRVLGTPLPESRGPPGITEALHPASTKAEQGFAGSPGQGDIPSPPSPFPPHNSTYQNPEQQLRRSSAQNSTTTFPPMKSYSAAAEHAAIRRLITADTKFEFWQPGQAHPHRRGTHIRLFALLAAGRVCSRSLANRASTSNIYATDSRRRAFEKDAGEVSECKGYDRIC
jgi:hypothetical protein